MYRVKTSTAKSFLDTLWRQFIFRFHRQLTWSCQPLMPAYVLQYEQHSHIRRSMYQLNGYGTVQTVENSKKRQSLNPYLISAFKVSQYCLWVSSSESESEELVESMTPRSGRRS
jgi:hypothetical protein